MVIICYDMLLYVFICMFFSQIEGNYSFYFFVILGLLSFPTVCWEQQCWSFLQTKTGSFAVHLSNFKDRPNLPFTGNVFLYFIFWTPFLPAIQSKRRFLLFGLKELCLRCAPSHGVLRHFPLETLSTFQPCVRRSASISVRTPAELGIASRWVPFTHAP